VTTALKRLLGLRVDLTEFERFAAHDDRLGPLGRRFRGIKPPRFPTVFECLVNAIGEYVLLRGLGRLNVFPGDDVGARNNLLRWLGLTGPLDYDGVRRYHPVECLRGANLLPFTSLATGRGGVRELRRS